MNNGILIIAHAPLANALRQCALHVFPDCAESVIALDIQPNLRPEESLATCRIALDQMNHTQVLVLTDLFGATPCNVAQRLVDGARSRLVAGVNLPMLLRAVTYRQETLDIMLNRAMTGGAQGLMQVAVSAPQNQPKKKHDPDHHDHQQ